MLVFLYLLDTPEDRDKLEQLYLAYHNKMLALAISILHDQYDAEDAVHDAFYAIARHITAIHEPLDSDRTIGYLMVTVKNCSYDILRKHKKEAVTKKEAADIPDKDDILEELCSEETYEKIVNILLDFHPLYSSVLYLHFVEELSSSEIAKRLNRKVSTVKNQLCRGKKLLIEIIRKETKKDDR